ncbi:MAG: glycoside hydrolase family 31 protein [Eubacteriales bacterium]
MWIEGWGENSLRVRATKMAQMPMEEWALLEQEETEVEIKINEDGTASIQNGKITAKLTAMGKLSIYNQNGKLLLDEQVRNRSDIRADYCSSLEIDAREFKPLIGGDYELAMHFESLDVNEKLFGMGQYQQPYLDLKGTTLELAHRNSQASVPFVLSSLGYGLLWHNPSIGRAIFSKNVMQFEAKSTKLLDYWVTAGDTPAEIEEAYANATGKVPMMPEYGMGFWQCKLRYQTQEELLEVARGYKKRRVPVSVIVVDFFHWPLQGEWKFDPVYWPDPDAMIAELKEMGMELMVSIWPQVDYRSENFQEMKQKGYLVRTERGMRICMDFQGNTVHYDATHPGAREYVWQKAKKNYYDKGVKIFWLDEAEPEYSVYDFENYRYHIGPNVQVGNLYPVMYAKTFFDGMEAEGQENIVNLLRCAWAGSQRYGALVWSGDIHSDFKTLRNQYVAGINMGIAGIPWWTTDIGGFFGGWVDDPEFHEVFLRWFAYGTFCPVMRLHGDREPHKPQYGTTGGATCLSGADNEIWSYGEKIEEICTNYIMLREKMRPYTTKLMEEAHEKGTPVMRPLFYEFPEDEKAWMDHEEYMYGGDILVAPIMYANMTERSVYLPAGATWTNMWTKEVFEGGTTITVKAPIEEIPVFVRDGKEIF